MIEMAMTAESKKRKKKWSRFFSRTELLTVVDNLFYLHLYYLSTTAIHCGKGCSRTLNGRERAGNKRAEREREGGEKRKEKERKVSQTEMAPLAIFSFFFSLSFSLLRREVKRGRLAFVSERKKKEEN